MRPAITSPLERISEDAYEKYRFLEEQSRNARYRCTRFSESDAALVQRSYYEPFREIVRSLLAVHGHLK
jgi:hypothetical protein